MKATCKESSLTARHDRMESTHKAGNNRILNKTQDTAMTEN